MASDSLPLLSDDIESSQQQWGPQFFGLLPKIGHFGCTLLALLHVRSNLRTYCWSSNEHLAKVAYMSEIQVKRELKKLEDLGLIYRNTWITSRGKKRHIIVSSKFHDYFREWLVPRASPEVCKRFMEAISKDQYAKSLRSEPLEEPDARLVEVDEDEEDEGNVKNKSTTIMPRDLPDTATNPRDLPDPMGKGSARSHALYEERATLSSIINNDEYIRPPNPPKGGSSSPSFSSSSLPSDDKTFIERLHDEIPKSCGEQFLPLAIEYYNLRRETIEARNNPIAAVIHAIKNGYALTDVEEIKHKARLEEREREARENPARMAPEVARIQQRPETTERYQQSMKSFTEAVSVRLENGKMKLYEIGPKGYKWSAENMGHVEQRSVYDANTVKDLVCLCMNSGNDKALEWIMAQKTPKNRHLYPDW